MACSDMHVGHSEDGLDGEKWFSGALADIQSLGIHIDYALVLGDLVHDATPEQYSRYLSARGSGTITEWYELAGNHDHAPDGLAAYRAQINSKLVYSIIDGNVVWIFISDEQDSTVGEISHATYDWLSMIIAQHGKDKNIIVCSHQLVYGTVANIDKKDDRYLVIGGQTAKDLSRLPVDVWLCGHEHHYPWNNGNIYYNGRTTYINIASLHHAYATGESHSFFLELKSGQNHITATRRLHDTQTNAPTFSIPLSFPLNFPQSAQRTRIEMP